MLFLGSITCTYNSLSPDSVSESDFLVATQESNKNGHNIKVILN